MLGCDFDPQGEQVYSVKWYKGGQEIFRYMPSNKLHPVAVFPRPGVTINEVGAGVLTKKSPANSSSNFIFSFVSTHYTLAERTQL